MGHGIQLGIKTKNLQWSYYEHTSGRQKYVQQHLLSGRMGGASLSYPRYSVMRSTLFMPISASLPTVVALCSKPASELRISSPTCCHPIPRCPWSGILAFEQDMTGILLNQIESIVHGRTLHEASIEQGQTSKPCIVAVQ